MASVMMPSNHQMTAEAIHPISSYAIKLKPWQQQQHQHYYDFPLATNNNFRKRRLQQALVNLEERQTLQDESCLSSILWETPITTTMYYRNEWGLSEIMTSSDESASFSCQTIFTSLGGEDDDNNNNNNDTPDSQPTRRSLGLLKTIIWFAIGSLLTIPFTEFVMDPLVLTWGVAFFGWLLYEEYDYPNHINPREQDEIVYPGCTDRQYFMTVEEAAEEEQAQAEPQQHPQSELPSTTTRMISHLPFHAHQQSPRGGSMHATTNAATTTTNGFKRRSVTFCGIQAAMIVLGDWMVRLVRMGGSSGGGGNENNDIVPCWLVAISLPVQVASVICSMVVQYRVQRYQMQKDTTCATAAAPGMMNHSTKSKQRQHPIPYWLGYCMDHIAILLPIALLAFEFLFDSNWLWTFLTTIFSRHASQMAHVGQPFQPLLGRLNEISSSR